MVLFSGIKDAEREKKNFKKWRERSVHSERLSRWADKELRKGWGFKAAARAFHIASTGHDAEIAGQYKDNTPTTIPLRLGRRVPGAPTASRNLYDVSQVLAWLAQDRRDVQEQLDWRQQIPKLLKPLMR